MGALGSVIGGAIGSAVAPGAGTAVGSQIGSFLGDTMKKGNSSNGGNNGAALSNVLGKVAPEAGLAAIKGLVQSVKAKRLQKKADAAFPEQEDPELRALLTNVARRKRAFQTGTALEGQMSNIRSLGRTGVNAAFRAGGGAAGLNRINQLIQQGMLGLQEASLKGEMFYAEKEQGLTEQIAQTKLEKQLLKYNQKQADAKQMKTSANRNLNMALAKTLKISPSDPSITGSVPNMQTQGSAVLEPNVE